MVPSALKYRVMPGDDDDRSLTTTDLYCRNYAADLSSAASANETPHSPQRKMFRSVGPSGRGAMRARCIERPQFGQGGPALIGLPAGRGKFCGKFCILNMVYLMRASRRVLKRTIGIQTPV